MIVFLSHIADATEPFSLHRRKKHISSFTYSIQRKQKRPLLFRGNHSQQPQSKGSNKVSARKLIALRLQKPTQGVGSLAERFSYQMESKTKWDLGSPQTYHSVEPYEKFVEDMYLDGSLVPRLQGELWKAQSRIKELEAKNIRCFIRKHRKEKTDPVVDYFKEKLSKERKEMKRAQAENSRLKKKILDMESSARRLRRDKDTMEKVCEELVMRIDELKADTRRIWDETEEERQMLHMVEMWKEERVRVKLMDAKLALEEKFEEMNWFVEELEKCLEMGRDLGVIEEMSLKRGEDLIKTARSMEVVDGKMDFERFKFLSEEDN